MRTFLAAAAFCACLGLPANAQWLTYPNAGIPRLANGEPDLKAAPPRTPDGKVDLSGIWVRRDNRYLQDIGADIGELPMQPWAQGVYQERRDNLGKDRPAARCLPRSLPSAMMIRDVPFKILPALPGTLVILFEQYQEYRQIFTDGRTFAANLQTEPDRNPTWWGYSVGRWEDDAFVVETLGFNDKTWLDDQGHPHSEAMRVTERYRRPTFGRLEIEFTFDDPKVYTRPWTVRVPFELMPDQELIEHVCENERDQPHLVGK